MIKHQSIKSTLLLYLGSMVAILFVVESVALLGMIKTKNSLKTVYEDRTVALDNLNRIEVLLYKNRLAIATSLITPTPDVISRNIEQIEKSIKEVEEIGETTWLPS